MAGRHRANENNPADVHRRETERQTTEAERKAIEDTRNRLRTGDWDTPDQRK